MPTLTLELPDFINIELREIKLLLAAKLYEEGQLSLGQAAELVGISKRSLMELLGQYGVSIFNYEAQEITGDFDNA